MFEGAVSTLMSILSLSIGGVSVTSIIASFIVLSKKIKSVSLTKDYVEKAFEKAVLPANVRIDISQKIIPLVKQALSEIEDNMKNFIQEQKDEYDQMKDMVKLVLSILSKFSHIQQLTDEEKALLDTFVQCSDSIKEVEL